MPSDIKYIRIYHLFGGIRMVVEYPSRKMTLQPPGALAKDLEGIADLMGGLVGAEFITSAAEADGTVPREWLVCELKSDGRTPWLSRQLEFYLQRFMGAASEQGRWGFELACWQLLYHLRACADKLRQISDLYFNKLTYLLRDGSRWQVGRVKTLHTLALQDSINSALQEFCVTRDLIARMIAKFQPAIYAMKGNRRCDSMARLINNWSPASTSDTRLDQIRTVIETANRDWMRELGQYRDCYVHDALLHDRFSATERREDQGLRFINHYLPDDPNAWRDEYSWEKITTDVISDANVEETYRRYDEHLSKKRDCLKYIHRVLLSIYSLLEELLPLLSPVDPLPDLPAIKPIPGTLRIWQE